jgi:hypothetical protein
MENESNNKQSSIEWLEEVYLNTGIDRRFHFEVAKAMHKEEIENAYRIGFVKYLPYTNAEQYYAKTYGGKDGE